MTYAIATLICMTIAGFAGYALGHYGLSAIITDVENLKNDVQNLVSKQPAAGSTV